MPKLSTTYPNAQFEGVEAAFLLVQDIARNPDNQPQMTAEAIADLLPVSFNTAEEDMARVLAFSGVLTPLIASGIKQLVVQSAIDNVLPLEQAERIIQQGLRHA